MYLCQKKKVKLKFVKQRKSSKTFNSRKEKAFIKLLKTFFNFNRNALDNSKNCFKY